MIRSRVIPSSQSLFLVVGQFIIKDEAERNQAGFPERLFDGRARD